MSSEPDKLKPKHTPGPWGRNIKPASKYNTIYAGEAPKHVHICHLSVSGLSQEEIEGNCNLITAAPNLVRMLELLICACTDSEGREREEFGHGVTSRVREAKDLLLAVLGSDYA